MDRGQELEVRALGTGRAGEACADVFGDHPFVERVAAGVPVPDRGVESGERFIRGFPRNVGADAEPDGGQYGRVRRFGQQHGDRLQAMVGGGHPQIQQGRAAAHVQCAGGGVGLRHGALEVRPEREGAAGAGVAELPGLGVVHRRGGGGIGDEVGQCGVVERSREHRGSPGESGMVDGFSMKRIAALHVWAVRPSLGSGWPLGRATSVPCPGGCRTTEV
ncbi:hypothetical protein [Streptomyces sp. NBC_00846]|uniref:hypothetical protein n=1 Tax=Streptomyces sp. NBC_00846 TaxID=2975849 RepID=UPI00386E3235